MYICGTYLIRNSDVGVGCFDRCLKYFACLVFAAFFLQSPLHANPDDAWVPIGNVSISGTVKAIVTDTDGSVYIGGEFSSAGDIEANNIAKWDPVHKAWETLGSGMDYAVEALAVGDDGSLYAGGAFTSAGGVSASKIAKWDPSSHTWEALGVGLNSDVLAIAAATDGSIYVGGRFTTAGGVSANRIARWDASTQTWHTLGSGLNSWAHALTIALDGSLYVGGQFQTAGGISANRVAKWTPESETWHSLGSGLNHYVDAMVTTNDGSLYVGGQFWNAGDNISTTGVARWNPESGTWHALGSGLNHSVFAMVTDVAGSIYVGGTFTTAGGVNANRIAKWNLASQSWEALDSGVDGVVFALASATEGSIFVGGDFTNAGDIRANRIAKWDLSETRWATFGESAVNNTIRTLATATDGSIYAAGEFRSAGAISANRLAKWNPGSRTWLPLDSGLNSSVYALAIDPAGSLYAAGNFSAAGEINANRVAKWNVNSESWEALGTGLAGGGGSLKAVRALTIGTDGSLYVGGEFTSAGGAMANRIARWNPTANSWESLGPGFNSTVYALATTNDGSLYAGGYFTNSGGARVDRIAKWNHEDETWEPLGAGLNNGVHVLLADPNGSIYAGGEFTVDLAQGLNVSRIAKWNPETHAWEALGGGLNNAPWALTSAADGSIFVGGEFTTSGDLSSNRIAKWNTKYQIWETLGSGLNNTVFALATSQDRSLYVGGEFTVAGTKVSTYLAKWIPPNNPPTSEAGTDQTIEATSATGATAVLDASNSYDEDGDELTYSWSGSFGTETGVTIDVTLPIGTTTVTLEVNDGSESSTDTIDVTVIDSTSPDVYAPQDVSMEATGALTPVTAEQLGEATVEDIVDSTLAATADNNGPFPPGDTIVTWSATDTAGNIASATQTVTITDTEAPSVSAPTDITIEATGSTTSVELGTASANDTVDGALTATADDSGPFTVGTTSITWSATDSAGNTGTAIQRVTITDNGLPVVIPPADIAREATAETTAVDLGTASATDTVDGSLTPTADDTGPYPVGVTSVTWTATDTAGNKGTDIQTVTITDTGVPAVTAPENVAADATGAMTAVDLGIASASDTVDGSLTPIADKPGPFPVGVTTVTWSATDNANNTGTATQQVTITDSNAPTITAPANVTAEATGATTAVNLGTATATDTVDGSLTAAADNPGPYTVGVTTVTWSATDTANNTGTATQTVTITDTTSPVVTAPTHITVEATGAVTSVDLGSAGANDRVDGELTATASNTGPFPVGETVVTWSATDNASNTGTATQTITVIDSSAPSVIAPATLIAEASGATTAVDLGVASATDTVDGTLNASVDNAGPFSVGNTTVTWRATDSAGNTGTATQTVTIVDTTPPAVTAPATISIEASGPHTAVGLGLATAVDTVDGELTATPDKPGPYPTGTSTITWSATDNAGNTGTATQTLIVNDSSPPAVTAPESITAEATGASTPVTLGAAHAVDTVDGALTATPDQTGPFPVGTTTVTWSASDSTSNTGSATQSVTIEDTTAPAVTPPTSVIASAAGPETSLALGTATAIDIVDGTLLPTADKNGPFAVGITTITWTATDAAGNTGVSTQTVTVSDDTAPVVTAPANVSVEASGVLTPAATGSASAIDAVDGQLTATPDNPGPYPVGSNTVTWRATDAAGNVGTATQTITVIDGSAPQVTAPADISVEATGMTTAVDAGNAVAIDTVDGTLTATADRTGPFPVGSTTIVWSATDSAGNTGSATQTITITDSQPPSVTAPPAITLEAAGVTTPISIGSANATDIVDGVLTATPDKPGPYPVGVTSVVWSATDSAGNTGTAVQTITISDTSAPVVLAPAGITAEATGTTTTVNLGSANANDAVDGNITATPDNPGPFDPGKTTVTWTATDSAGNTGSAEQIISIVDTTSPTVVAPPAISATATGPVTSVALGSAGAEDIVDGELVATPDNPGPYPIGTTTITWSATDGSGNTGVATQTVTITDVGSPIVTAPPAITMEATGPATPVELGQASAVDTVDGTLTVTSDSTGPYAVGTTTVIWSATDSAGNTGTAAQLITIVDSLPPQIVTPANINAEATGLTTALNLGTATATDLVDGSLNATPDNPGPYPTGTTNVTWSVTDSAGNTGLATQSVTVSDVHPPVVTAPTDITVEATGVLTTVNLGSATAIDNVDGPTAVLPDSIGPFPVGVSTVIWSATDSSGGKGSATQTVTVIDTGPPVVTAPAGISLAATGATTEVNLGTASAVDAVDGTLLAVPDDAGPFPPGNSIITWTATDSTGNTGSATQTVVVHDSSAPVVTAPDNILVEATAVLTPVSLGNASATDLVDGALVAVADNQGPFPVGLTTITWSAIDKAGNVGVATQTVTVTDTTEPSVQPPANIIQEATGSTTSVELGTGSATDAVDGALLISADNSGPYSVGTTQVTWSATDNAGNTGTAIQVVTITDRTTPVVTPPPNVSADATGPTTIIDIGNAIAVDTVDGTITATADNPGPYPVGVTTITWNATDSGGNTGSATQLVTLIDNNPPSITAPSGINTEATGPATSVDIGNASAVDSVDGSVTVTADNTGPFSVGSHTVIWSAADKAGNTSTATQPVVITDNVAPVVTAPADVTAEASGVTTEVDLGIAGATDLVDGAIVASTDQQGPFPVGETRVTWQASDSVGNTGTAQQLVRIVDTSPPKIETPADIEAEATGNLTSITLGQAAAIDVVDGPVDVTPDISGPFAIGTTRVRWTAVDNSGNTASAEQMIVVKDGKSPIVTAPPDIITEASGQTTSVFLGTASVTDDVDSNLIAIADHTGPFSLGDSTIIWTATDSAGNSGSAKQRVTIRDTNAPSISVPADIQAEATGARTSVAVGVARASDIVDGEVSVTPDNRGPFPVGETTVRWSATDSAGNRGSAAQKITITDSRPPVVIVPPDIFIEAIGTRTAVALGTASANDTVDGALPAYPDNRGPYAVGRTTVTWRATDSAGNSGTARQKITVSDNQRPVLVSPPDITAEATGETTPVELGTVVATDTVDGELIATPDKPSPYPIGRTIVTWSATDRSGNTSTATQVVTVVDSQPPIVSAPGDIIAKSDADSTMLDLGTAQATDVADGSLIPIADNYGPYSIGVTTVTWSATDRAGNTGTAIQTISISEVDADADADSESTTNGDDNDSDQTGGGSITVLDFFVLLITLMFFYRRIRVSNQ